MGEAFWRIHEPGPGCFLDSFGLAKIADASQHEVSGNGADVFDSDDEYLKWKRIPRIARPWKRLDIVATGEIRVMDPGVKHLRGLTQCDRSNACPLPYTIHVTISPRLDR